MVCDLPTAFTWMLWGLAISVRYPTLWGVFSNWETCFCTVLTSELGITLRWTRQSKLCGEYSNYQTTTRASPFSPKPIASISSWTYQTVCIFLFSFLPIVVSQRPLKKKKGNWKLMNPTRIMSFLPVCIKFSPQYWFVLGNWNGSTCYHLCSKQVAMIIVRVNV